MRGWKAWAAVVAVGVLLGTVPATQPVMAVVPLNPHAMAERFPMLEVPCAVNMVPLECMVDTGSAEGIVLSAGMAATVRAPIGPAMELWGVGGESAQHATSVQLAIGGHTITVTGAVAPTWEGTVLVGLPALRRLAPNGLRIDWSRHTVTLTR